MGFAVWLFRIAHQQISNNSRKRAWLPPVLVETACENAALDCNQQRTQLEQRESSAGLRVALASLVDQQAQVISLKYAAGLSDAEVGAVLGHSSNTVNALHYEALSKLHQLLTIGDFTI